MARKQKDDNSEPDRNSGSEPFCADPGAEVRRSGPAISATATQLERTADHSRPPPPDDQNAIRQYLLGSLDDVRLKQVEERLITDADFFEELEIAEDELIDEFLSHDLSEPDRDRFERHFLAAPERQRNLQFARAMRRQITPKPVVPWWNPQNYYVRAVAAVALVTVLAGLLVFRSRTAAEPTFANLTLTISDGDRASGAPVTKAKRDVDEFRVTLKLPEATMPASGYRSELITATEEPKPLKIIKQDAQTASVVIPTNKLSPVLYSIRLYAINTDGTEQRLNGDYFLNVE